MNRTFNATDQAGKGVIIVVTETRVASPNLTDRSASITNRSVVLSVDGREVVKLADGTYMIRASQTILISDDADRV